MAMSRVPDDVMRNIVEFATQSLRAVLSLQLISRHFYEVMRQTKMLSHVRARFDDLHDGQHLSVGLRHLSIVDARNALTPLALLCGLRTLHIPRCRTSSDIAQYLQNMTQLEELDLSNMVWLKILPMSLMSLKRLNIQNTGIQRLPYMPNLEELDVSSCQHVSDYIVFRACPNIRSLKMTDSLATILDFRKLTQLQELDISSSELTHLHVGPQLCVLNVELCEYLLEIPGLPNLLELNVQACDSLDVLPELPKLLKLLNCGSQTCPNSSMKQLRELGASKYTFERFEVLDLPGLEKLDLQGCEFVEQNFEKLPNLVHLVLELEASANVNCLPSSLIHLQLDDKVSDLDMSLVACNLTNLKTLIVNSDITDAGMMSIAKIRGLEHFCIDNNRSGNITSLGVSHLAASNLRHLELRSCAVDDLTVVSGFANLEVLIIWGNIKQLDPEPLANAQRLTTLEFTGCTLQSLRGLNAIPRLEMLSIVSCRVVSENIHDLIPIQVAFLTFDLISLKFNKQRVDFAKQLKASNSWMEIRV